MAAPRHLTDTSSHEQQHSRPRRRRGLAGLATAKVLHDLGWTVDLVERRQAFDAIPTGLFLHANGMRAFAALGAAAALRARGRDIERLRMRSADGSTQGVADLTSVWPGVGPSVTIDRGLSLQALVEWCPVAVRRESVSRR